MDTSTIVNIILCVLSFILAAVSVVTVVITLRQNHKMIESSTRPYLQIYCDVTYFQNIQCYLVLKNFGTSSATIVDFFADCDLSSIADATGHPPFESLCNVSIAPGQKIVYIVDGSSLIKKEVITFSIKYKSDAQNIYSDKIQFHTKYLNNITISRASTNGQELRAISFALQDISEKMI